MPKEKIEVKRRLEFHDLMDVLGVWSADIISDEYHHEVLVERDGKRYSVWVKDNRDGTYDLNGAEWVFKIGNKLLVGP